MKPLNTNPNSSVMKLIPSSTHNGFTFTFNLHDATINLSKLSRSSFKTITAHTTFHATTTLIATFDEPDAMEMRRPRAL